MFPRGRVGPEIARELERRWRATRAAEEAASIRAAAARVVHLDARMRRGDEPLARELNHTPGAVDPFAAVPVTPLLAWAPAGTAASVLSVFPQPSWRRRNPPQSGPPGPTCRGREPLGGDSTGLATRIRLIRRSSIAPQRRTTPSADPVIASRACQVRAGGRARRGRALGVMKHGTKNKNGQGQERRERRGAGDEEHRRVRRSPSAVG